MARCPIRDLTVDDGAGNVVQGARVYFYENNTTTPLGDLFAAESGGVAITSVVSDTEGDVVAWKTSPGYISVKITDNAGAAVYANRPQVARPFDDYWVHNIPVFPAPGDIYTPANPPAASAHPDLATHDALGLATDANVTTAVTNHEAAANPHPTYETSAEAQAKVDTHVNDTTAAHAAASVGFTPAGSIAATNVQAAIEEVASEAGGGGSAHVIKENGSALTQRANLNFVNGLVATDDAANSETEVAVDYAGTAEIADIAAAEAAGSSAKVPRGDHVHAHPVIASGNLHPEYALDGDIPAFATPAVALGTAAAAGATGTVIRSDSTIVAFDATSPTTQAFGDAAAVGAAAVAARRDHKHAMPANPVTGHEAAADPHTGYVLESVLDAETVLYATVDNTPAALSVPASRIVGRKASGSIVALTAAELRAILLGELEKVISWSYAGTIAVTTGKARWYADRAYTIEKVRASVDTQPTGAAIRVDVNKNGTTIFTTQGNRPDIAVSTNTDEANNPDVTALAAGDYLTVDIDVIGSTIAGADLTVQVVLGEA